MTITPASQPSQDWPQWFFIGSIVAFVVLLCIELAIAGVRARKPLPPSAPTRGFWSTLSCPAPGPDWTFVGWASVLTGVGAIFGTVLGDITLPLVPQEIDKDTLIRMNLIFGAMITIGPFLFHALRRRKAAQDWSNGLNEPLKSKIRNLTPQQIDKAGLWGRNLVLMIAYAISGVAVLGELGALTLLGQELTNADWQANTVLAVSAVLAVLAVIYFVAMVDSQLSTDWLRAYTDSIRPDPADELLKRKHFPLEVMHTHAGPAIGRTEPEQTGGATSPGAEETGRRPR